MRKSFAFRLRPRQWSLTFSKGCAGNQEIPRTEGAEPLRFGDIDTDNVIDDLWIDPEGRPEGVDEYAIANGEDDGDVDLFDAELHYTMKLIY